MKRQRHQPVSRPHVNLFATLLLLFFVLQNVSAFDNSNRKVLDLFPWHQRKQEPSLQPLNRGDSVGTRLSLQSTEDHQAAISYHLVWTQNFWKKYVATTLGLVILDRKLLSFSRIQQQQQQFWLSSVSLPLLASSCCLIQLLSNYFLSALGCLGLNTALGPSRPYFLSLFIYLSLRSSPLTKTSLILMQFGIAFLPEMVHIWNLLRRQKRGVSTSSGMVATVELDIPTMGCVACINKIDSSITNKLPKNTTVLDIHSQLDPTRSKGGTAKVSLRVESMREAESVGKTLVDTVASIGFGESSVTNIKLEQGS